MLKRPLSTRGRLIPFWAASAIALLCLAGAPAGASAAKATPSLVVTVEPTEILAGSFSIIGFHLSGGDSPSGQVEVLAFQNLDGRCEGASLSSGPRTVEGDTSAPFETLHPAGGGTVRAFQAIYSGDADNEPVTSPCATLTVRKATPAVLIGTPGSATAGEGFSVVATLVSGLHPEGTVSFRAYGPDDQTCTGLPKYSSPPTYIAAGVFESPSISLTEAGRYRLVATYSGDAANESVSSECGGIGSFVIVGKARPTVTVQGNGPVAFGGEMHPSVTVAGGSDPTGSVFFEFHEPGRPSCSSTTLSDPVHIEGDGTYPLPSWPADVLGTWQITAVYSGDANDEEVITACEAPGSSVDVKNQPTIAGIASGGGQLGNISVNVKARLAGATNLSPGDSVELQTFAPDDVDCTGRPVYTDVIGRVTGSGTYEAEIFSLDDAGTYRVVASFQGDAMNLPATSTCGEPGSTFEVRKALPSLAAGASPAVHLGAPINGSLSYGGNYATLSGGTLTLSAYGPDDADCSGAPVHSDTWTGAAGSGVEEGTSFRPAEGGTYRFVASYSGDEDHEEVTTTCGEPGSTVEVLGVLDMMLLEATPSTAEAGAPVTLTARIEGFEATGTVTFSDAGTVIGTAPVGADALATLTTTSLAIGPHQITASYDGDRNNEGAISLSPVEVSITEAAAPLQPPPDQPPPPAPPAETHGADPPSPPPVSPLVTVTYSPDDPHTPNPAGGARWTFRFADQAPGTTFLCRLDGGKWKACSSPAVYRHLKRGRHTFAVKSIAADGTESPVQKLSFRAGRRR